MYKTKGVHILCIKGCIQSFVLYCNSTLLAIRNGSRYLSGIRTTRYNDLYNVSYLHGPYNNNNKYNIYAYGIRVLHLIVLKRIFFDSKLQ